MSTLAQRDEVPQSIDPAPWWHESGSRYATEYDAPPGVVIWLPRSITEEDS